MLKKKKKQKNKAKKEGEKIVKIELKLLQSILRTRICYSYFLVLAGDPPVLDMIYLAKYFHDFTKFIYQDRKIPAQSCSNTSSWPHFEAKISVNNFTIDF